MSEMEVVKVPGGWAVRFESGERTEAMTRRAARDRMARVTAHRADLAAHEAALKTAKDALLARHGIGPVDYRDLEAGDLFTWQPEEPPRVVTAARHFDNGASLIVWEPGRGVRPAFAMTLMTPGHQAYGRYRQGSGHGTEGSGI